MVRIVLVMHAPLGAAFSQCASHVLGGDPNLTVFDIDPVDQPDRKIPELVELMTRHSDSPVLVLCDIFGATPFNIASQALEKAGEQGVDGHLITGTNLCMVLKALTEHQENPDKLTEKVRLGALKGIIMPTGIADRVFFCTNKKLLCQLQISSSRTNWDCMPGQPPSSRRSEEHTSALQSLMRNEY